MSDYPGWRMRHDAAMATPRQDELEIVAMMATIRVMVSKWHDDYVLREGVADIIKGTRVLLNSGWGNRLDTGTLDELLVAAAEKIHYDLDVERFTDGFVA